MVIILIRYGVARCSDCHKSSQDTIFSEVFYFVAMLKHDMFRSMFPIPFSKHTFWFFIVLFSILRQAVYNSQCPSGSNHCFI